MSGDGVTGTDHRGGRAGTGDEVARQKQQDRLRRIATRASVTVASCLIIAKLAAFLATDSVSILSSLIDSSTDLLASLVTLVAVRQAMRPADADHRFGHGKAEALAALAQSAFIGGSALILSFEAIRRLFRPELVTDSAIGIGVMVLSIILTGALIALQRHVVQVTGSVAISADRWHYTGDLLTNTAVILALLLTAWSGIAYFDPLFGLGIAAFLLNGARRVAVEALDVLMDRELPDAERDRIIAAVMTHPEARGVHDLRTRSDGSNSFIELHLELDPRLTLAAAHDITDRIERSLCRYFPRSEVIIHQEPAGLKDERLDERIADQTDRSPTD